MKKIVDDLKEEINKNKIEINKLKKIDNDKSKIIMTLKAKINLNKKERRINMSV